MQIEQWNSNSHLERVESDYYSELTKTIIGPKIAAHVLSRELPESKKTIHDLGGYDGLLLAELLEEHLDDTWSGIVTDITQPESLKGNVEFYKVASEHIASPLGKSTVSTTVSCNTMHLLDDAQLTNTLRAVRYTSKPGASIVTVIPHPVTHRVAWSDFDGISDNPARTERRGVFIDAYRQDREAEHSFLKDVKSYPRTVEGFIGLFLSQELRLKAVEPIHIDPSCARPGKQARFYETLPHLPTYLLSAWEVQK
jgi:hypothetical protein